MYETYYGLTEKPFNLTPDPRFVYLSDKHNEALAHLVYGIQNRSGFVMISGEIGTGKTTICRKLLSELGSDTEIAFIFNPYLSPEELLRKINEDFGIETRAQSVKDLIDELNAYLLERATEGKNCVLVIDEAQNLDPKVLEQIRLLSNLETETQKLLQIVLIGQPELAQMLELKELRQLNQRITARYHLKELGPDEALQYIAFRLRVAGGKGKIRFTRAAFKRIHQISNGTPRVINALCDRCLLIGYTKESHTITPGIVRQAAREIQGERVKVTTPSRRRGFSPRRVLAAAAVVVIIAAFGLTATVEDVRALPGIVAEHVGSWMGAAPGDDGQSTANDPDESPLPGRMASASLLPAVPKAEAAAPDPIPVEPASTLSDLPSALASIDAATARTNALTAVLRAWNMAVLGGMPLDDSSDALQRFAQQNGLTLEQLELSADQLLAINLPALTQLNTPGGTVWGAIVGSTDDTVSLVLATGSGEPFARAQFDAAFAGTVAVPWLDPTPLAPPLMPSVRGAAVEELQRTLHDLGVLRDHVTGQYDVATRGAVERVQQSTGLMVDGLAGRQTRMVLSSWQANRGMPSLSATPLTPERIATLVGATPVPSLAPTVQLTPPAPVSAAITTDIGPTAVRVSELPPAGNGSSSGEGSLP